MQEEEKEVGAPNDVTMGDEGTLDVTEDSATIDVNDTLATQELNTEVLEILPLTVEDKIETRD